MLNLRLEDQAGDVLKKFRYGRKRSLKEVAQEAGLSPDQLRALESGESVPTPDQLKALGSVLGFDGEAMARLHLHPEDTPEIAAPPRILPVQESYGGYPVWCTIVRHRDDPRRGLLVDTGGGGSTLLETLRTQKITIEGVLLTHGHGDHGGGFAGAITHSGVPVLLSREDYALLPEIQDYQGPVMTPEEGCRLLAKKGWSLTTRPAPGHTPGSVAYHTEGTLMVGDTVFCGSAGRSFTPDDFKTQLSSIRMLMTDFPDDTVIISGHGPLTTVFEERHTNPFVRIRDTSSSHPPGA